MPCEICWRHIWRTAHTFSADLLKSDIANMLLTTIKKKKHRTHQTTHKTSEHTVLTILNGLSPAQWIQSPDFHRTSAAPPVRRRSLPAPVLQCLRFGVNFEYVRCGPGICQHQADLVSLCCVPIWHMLELSPVKHSLDNLARLICESMSMKSAQAMSGGLHKQSALLTHCDSC